MDEREDILLGFADLIRQTKRAQQSLIDGISSSSVPSEDQDVAFERPDKTYNQSNDWQDTMDGARIFFERFRRGEVSQAEAEAALINFQEQLETRARELADSGGDPALLMGLRAGAEAQIRAEYEPGIRELSDTAKNILLPDSVEAAGRGLTFEEWVAEVLDGHAGDEQAQLLCLQEIDSLRRKGLLHWMIIEEHES
jgi:hypothetical protein